MMESKLTQTGLVVGLNDVTQDDLAAAYTAVVGTLTVPRG